MSSTEDTRGVDLWGVQVPLPTGEPPRRRPPRTMDETWRLVRLLQEEPGVAGRVRDLEISEVEPGSSGARMVYGTWDGALPAIVKLGAGDREVHWARQLSRHAPNVMPGVFAAGYALGGEPLPWLIMERC